MLALCGICVNAQSGLPMKTALECGRNLLRRPLNRRYDDRFSDDWRKNLADEPIDVFLLILFALALNRCDRPLDAKLNLTMCPWLVDVV